MSLRRFFALAAVLSFIGIAPTESKENEWHWVKTEAVGDRWETLQGIADVEIARDKIHILLRESDNDRDGRFEIAGTIDIGELGKNRRGIQEGSISVIVTRLFSDMRPTQFMGTYRKAIYTPRGRDAFGTLYDEIIVMSDTVSTISLMRDTKVPRTSDTSPN